MLQPLILKFFSTLEISREKLISFAVETKAFAGGSELSGESTLETDESVVGFDNLEHFFQRKLLPWNGCLTVVFGDGKGISGRCDLLRLHDRTTQGGSLGDKASYRTHEFTVEISPSRLADLSDSDLIFSYFSRVSALLDVQFALGNEDDNHLAELFSPKGLEAGLPNVFQLMAFGVAFVDIIKAERLVKLPVARCERLSESIISIQLVEIISGIVENDSAARRRIVREAIGEEYFADLSAAPFNVEGGQVGLLPFIGSIFKSKRDYESKHRLARKRPCIDWSGLFVSEQTQSDPCPPEKSHPA